jgi:hypothetical protein
MAFILTVISYYVECDQARVEAMSMPPAGVKSVSAICVSGDLPKGWVEQ